MKEILEINTVEEFEKHLLESKENHEVMIFKYSPYCTISFVADNVMSLWFKKLQENIPVKILKINVITARSLSNSVAEKYGIRHESPQLIWLHKSGEIKWQGSHHRINNEILEKYVPAV